MRLSSIKAFFERRHRDADDRGGIYDGTVGWDDGDSHFEEGVGADGTTLVKVTLYKGAPAGGSQGPRAQGRQIRCRTSWPAHAVPPDGAEVHVSIPAGRLLEPGAGMILGSPTEAKRYAEEATFFRVDTAKGYISLFTTDDLTPNGKSVFLQVRPDGYTFSHPHIKQTLDKNGFHVLHSSGARIDLGAISGLPPPLDALGSYLKLSAAQIQLEASAIAIGTVGGTPDQVAHATPTIAALNALMAAVSSLATAMGAVNTLALVVDPDPTTKSTAAAASATALLNVAGVVGAAASAVAGAIPLVPTNSATVT